jgi:hypothetical protein
MDNIQAEGRITQYSKNGVTNNGAVQNISEPINTMQ